jgi:hypothetical protein
MSAGMDEICRRECKFWSVSFAPFFLCGNSFCQNSASDLFPSVTLRCEQLLAPVKQFFDFISFRPYWLEFVAWRVDEFLLLALDNSADS